MTMYEDPEIEAERYIVMLPERIGWIYIKNTSTKYSLRENCYFRKFKNLQIINGTGPKYSVTLGP